MSELASINTEQRLFSIKAGEGFTCLGFDVAQRRMEAVSKWLAAHGVIPQTRSALIGSAEHFQAYQIMMKAGADFSARTGKRCDCELTPAMVGLEGQRVEVILPDGERSRFYVGKSTGWMPCHLEIKTKRSHGGGPVYFPDGATLRVLS